MHQRAAPNEPPVRESVTRWECHCQPSPVLLGTYDADGKVNIKVRDRYWHIVGRVWTTCPRCGKEHALDLQSGSTVDAQPAQPAVS